MKVIDLDKFYIRNLAGNLLKDIYVWQNEHMRKLRLKYPNATEEENRERMLNYGATKFREQTTKLLMVKLKTLTK